MPGIDTFSKLVLHMDGADGATTFPDSATGKAVTVGGNCQIDTAQSVFGGASGLFDGNGDYLQLADSADWNFGSGNFTIDTRIRYAALPALGQDMNVCGQRLDSNNLWRLLLNNTAGVYTWVVLVKVAGVTTISFSRAAVVITDTWYHLAWIRNGNDHVIAQDGVQIGLVNTDTDAMPDTNAVLGIGADIPNASDYHNGWMDEFRISKGIARWTSFPFTPPTEAYAALPSGGGQISLMGVG